jgi:hypothetical protein
MKVKIYLIPLAVLVLAGVWLINQSQAISSVDNTNSQIQKTISVVSSSNPTAVLARAEPKAPAKVAAPAVAKTDNEPFDWKKIAAQCAAIQQTSDAAEFDRLRQRFELMSPAELVAALQEIDTLQLSAATRMALMLSLVTPLAQKDPELALTRYMDFLGDHTFGMGWQLAADTKKWAEKDPAKAAAWFAEQVAAGRFDSKSLDGKSDIREKIEGGLFAALLDTDPAAAARSLGTMAEEQRIQVLGKYASEEVTEGKQLDFIKLLRSQLSEQDQAKLLGEQGSRMARLGGYPKIDAFLQRISATPAERALCAEQAAIAKIQSANYEQKITRADLDAMRKWTTTQAPESTDSITGKAIADALWHGSNLSFADASVLVLQYNKASGNDDTLSSFLGSVIFPQNKDQARVLAAQITDPKRREEILKKLQ